MLNSGLEDYTAQDKITFAFIIASARQRMPERTDTDRHPQTSSHNPFDKPQLLYSAECTGSG